MGKNVYSFKEQAISLNCVGMMEESANDFNIFSNAITPILVQKSELILHDQMPFEGQLLDTTNDTDYSVHFKRVDFTPGNNVYIFFQVEFKKDTDCILLLPRIDFIRIWIDGEYFSATEPQYGFVFTLPFSKGTHNLCFECVRVKQDDIFSFRLNSIEAEDKDPYTSLTKSLSNRLPAFGFHVEKNASDPKVFQYMFLPADTLNFTEDISYQMIAYPQNICIEQGAYNRKQLYTLDVARWEEQLGTAIEYIAICCECTSNIGRKFARIISLIPGDPLQYMQTLYTKIETLKEKQSLSEYEQCALDFWSLYLPTVNCNNYRAPDVLGVCTRCLQELQDGTLHKIHAGANRRYFYSELDGMAISYTINVPENYDPLKQYPLVVLFSINAYDDYALRLKFNDEVEPFLCADVSGRGVTTGSYIGEASNNEIVEDIAQKFSVDRDRIYASGNSNGAYSAWVQGQHYPHKYAGIFPEAGNANHSLLCNVWSLKTYAFATNHDGQPFIDMHAAIADRMKECPNFKSIIADKHIHNAVDFVSKTPAFLNELFANRRQDYPKEFYYKTYRNRLRRNYWVEMHSIAFGVMMASVQASYDTNQIVVNCKGTTGVTIQIPPSVERSGFTVLVNETQFSYSHFDGEKLYYSISENGCVTEVSALPQIDNIYKGNGLLDVYLTPMKVLVPEKETGMLLNYAHSFSKPSSNGYNPELFVKYPIQTIGLSDDPKSILDRAAVVLDLNSDAPFFSWLRSIVPIKTMQDGYEYRGEKYEGDYCVMQVIQNPFNANASITYINANNARMYSKNFFTRNVIINSYASGFQPYYNVAATVLDKDGYKTVLEYGCELMKNRSNE